MYKNYKSRNSWLSSIKSGWVFAVLSFTNLCLFLDRVGRIFDAQQLIEVAVEFFGVVVSAYFFLFHWLLLILTGA